MDTFFRRFRCDRPMAVQAFYSSQNFIAAGLVQNEGFELRIPQRKRQA
jgi:hypothetical protein